MGTGVLTDCWREEERGHGMSMFQIAPVLGPAVGPIGTLRHYTQSIPPNPLGTWR